MYLFKRLGCYGSGFLHQFQFLRILYKPQRFNQRINRLTFPRNLSPILLRQGRIFRIIISVNNIAIFSCQFIENLGKLLDIKGILQSEYFTSPFDSGTWSTPQHRIRIIWSDEKVYFSAGIRFSQKETGIGFIEASQVE